MIGIQSVRHRQLTGAFSPADPHPLQRRCRLVQQAKRRACTQRLAACQGESRRNPSPKNLDKIIYELQDKHIDLRRLRDHIQAIGGTITDMNDAYLGEEALPQAPCAPDG